MNLKREPKREISQGDHLNDLLSLGEKRKCHLVVKRKYQDFVQKRVF